MRQSDLQTTNTVEQDGHAPEVCMSTQRGSSVIRRLRWCLDEAHLISADRIDPVQAFELTFRELQSRIQEAQKVRDESMATSTIVFQQWTMLIKIFRRREMWIIRWVRYSKSLVFADVVEFIPIFRALRIDDSSTITLVSGDIALV